MTTGLPPLPKALHERRALELWTRAAVERVRRESSVECSNADVERGRVQGAERMRDLLLSCLPENGKAE